MYIRAATQEDIEQWLALRIALWPEGHLAEHHAEMTTMLTRPQTEAVFLAFDLSGAERTLAGFIEVALRPWAEGCTTSPVGYLEGLYIVEPRRGEGTGRLLVQAAETWARAQGCTEMASDAELDNHISQAFHHHLGYAETTRLVCFRKSLHADAPAEATG